MPTAIQNLCRSIIQSTIEAGLVDPVGPEPWEMSDADLAPLVGVVQRFINRERESDLFALTRLRLDAPHGVPAAPESERPARLARSVPHE